MNIALYLNLCKTGEHNVFESLKQTVQFWNKMVLLFLIFYVYVERWNHFHDFQLQLSYTIVLTSVK